MANLKFYKSSAAPTTAAEGSIWFDSTNKVLNVKTATDWEVYDGGRKVVDASLANNKLTISKVDGSSVVLDFSDVASAKETMKIFEALDSRITTAQTQADKGVSDAAAAQTAAEAAQTAADSKIASVTGSNAISVDTAEHAATVALKLANKGNVTLSQDTEGLSASVTIEPAKVLGVDNDHILSLTGDKLVTATLSVGYGDAASEALAGKKTIKLIGKEGYILSEIDASDFIKDGMINEVSFDEATKKLTITFNTDAGKDAIDVDLKSLVDTYKAGDGLTLGTDGTFSVNDTIARSADVNTKITGANEYADGLKSTIDTYTVNGKAISESPVLSGTDVLVGGEGDNKASTVSAAVEDLYGKVNAAASGGVLSIGSASGHLTLKGDGTDNGSVNLKVTGKELSAEIVGLGSAAYTESAAYDAAGEAAKVLGTTADTSASETVRGAIKLANEKATPAQVDSKIEAAAANYATAAQGLKADSALQSVSASGSDYISASFEAKTNNEQALSVSATVQAVATASTTAKGLAEASDVKDYVDNHVASTLSWTVFE